MQDQPKEKIMNNEFDVQPPMAPEHTAKKTPAAPDHVKSQFVGDSAVIAPQ